MVSRQILFAITAFFVASCGEGGIPGQPAGTPPSISNLSVAPISALHDQGGGWIDVEITVDFVDSEGDVNYLGANVLNSSGSILYVRGALLPELAGQMSGTAHATIAISTATVGQFTLRVWMVDETIRPSNQLEVQFSII